MARNFSGQGQKQFQGHNLFFCGLMNNQSLPVL